jgi:Tfp pilus assembly protein PilX
MSFANQSTAVVAQPNRRERGTALFIALVITVVLTFLGMGLLTRSLLVSRIAGSERYSTKAFYAADAGINAAQARLKIRRTQAFSFTLADMRGGIDTTKAVTNITVNVTNLDSVGAPQPVVGTQVAGGQGGGEPLYMMFYKGTSTASQTFSRTERVVTATMSIGPVPLSISD